jgi:flagellar L-ring protein precursor FlgH
MRLALALVVALHLGGCAFIEPRVQIEDKPSAEVQTAAPAPTPAPALNGAIFQPAAYRPLFEDHRARHVGDTLTVQIVEKVSASARSTSSVDKTGKLDASVKAAPGVNPNSFLAGRGAATASGANSFEGKGATENSNDFSGTITAIVRGVLPNGHLLIVGEKQIGVNQSVDVLRFSGQVDPRNIQNGNSVASGLIANVRLEHRGRGQQAEAQAMGWLGRVFLNVLPL